MASIVHTEFSTRHLGVERAEAAVQAARRMRGDFDSARGLAAMLLAAIVSALLVVADQLLDAWTDGHLMAAWVTLWAVGFAALGLLAGTVRRFSTKVVQVLDGWAARSAQARADERLWSIALKDARLMAELQAVLAHDDAAPALRAGLARRARSHGEHAANRPDLG